MRRRVLVGALGLALVSLAGWLMLFSHDGSRRDSRADAGGSVADPLASAALEPASRAQAERIEPARADDQEPEPDAVHVLVRGGRRPIAGARVHVRADASSGARALTTTTDETGQCWLRGGYRPVLELEVTAPGFLGQRQELVWSERIELELLPCVAIEGRVLDEATGEPIAGAHLHVGRRWSWTPVGDEARTDADGGFRMDCVPDAEDVWISAWAEGTPEVRVELPRSERARDALEIELTRAPVFELQVLEFPSGRPVTNAKSGDSCTDASGRVSQGPWTTDDRFDSSVEAPGLCGVWVSLPPRTAGARTPLTVRLPKLARFVGTVRDARGESVPGATLEFRLTSSEDPRGTSALPALPEGWEYILERLGSATTDTRGRYVSSPLLPGASRHEVHVVHPGTGDVIVDAGPLGAAGTLTRFDVTLLPRATGGLEGSVRFNGNWLPGKVSWRCGRREGSCELDLDGHYRLPEVDAGEVELSLRSAWLDPVQAFLSGTRVTVGVETGRTTRHDFEFILPYAEIGGSVRDESGAPVEGAELTLRRVDPTFEGRDKTGSDGRWRESVPDIGGAFEVELAHVNEVFRVEGVRPGNLRVDFVVPTRVTLPLCVLDAASGQPVERWQVAWRRRGEAQFRRGLSGGHARRPEQTFPLELAPGEYELLAQASEFGYRSRRIDGLVLEAGRTPATLAIRLERGLELELLLAQGCIPPENESVRLVLLEEEAWPSSGAEAFNDGALTPDATIHARPIWFGGERRTTLRGLAPGRWRFQAFPDDVVVEPEWVTLPRAEPVVLRWFRR